MPRMTMRTLVIFSIYFVHALELLPLTGQKSFYLQISAALYDVFTSVDGGKGRTKDDDARIGLEEFLGIYVLWVGSAFRLSRDLTVIKKPRIISRQLMSTVAASFSTENGPNTLGLRRSKLKRILVRSWVETLSGNRKPKTIAGGRKNSKGSNLSTRKVTTFLKYLHAWKRPSSPTVRWEKLRCSEVKKDWFVKCDTNGTGECSLAEVGGFVLTTLKKSYDQKLGQKYSSNSDLLNDRRFSFVVLRWGFVQKPLREIWTSI